MTPLLVVKRATVNHCEYLRAIGSLFAMNESFLNQLRACCVDLPLVEFSIFADDSGKNVIVSWIDNSGYHREEFDPRTVTRDMLVIEEVLSL